MDNFSVALVGPYPLPYGGGLVHIESLRRRLAALDIPSVAPAYIPPRVDADASSLFSYVRNFLGVHSPVLPTCAWRLTIDAQGFDVCGFDHCIEMIRSLGDDFPKIGLGISLPQVTDVDYFRDLKARVAVSGIDDNFSPLLELYRAIA